MIYSASQAICNWSFQLSLKVKMFSPTCSTFYSSLSKNKNHYANTTYWPARSASSATITPWCCLIGVLLAKQSKAEQSEGMEQYSEAKWRRPCESHEGKLGVELWLQPFITSVFDIEDRASWYILIIKPTRCNNFSNFLELNLHVSDSISVHYQVSSTVHTAIVICLLAGCRHIPVAVCTVLDTWWWTEILSETCRVLFQE